MITINRISATNFIIIVDGDFSAQAFKELTHRATNLWPDAPPEIKHFADEITNAELLVVTPGGRLQNYEEQDTSKNKGETVRRHVVCTTCTSDNLIDVKVGHTSVNWKCSHCLAANHSEIK